LVLDDLVHAVSADGLDEGRNLVELLVIAGVEVGAPQLPRVPSKSPKQVTSSAVSVLRTMKNCEPGGIGASPSPSMNASRKFSNVRA